MFNWRFLMEISSLSTWIVYTRINSGLTNKYLVNIATPRYSHNPVVTQGCLPNRTIHDIARVITFKNSYPVLPGIMIRLIKKNSATLACTMSHRGPSRMSIKRNKTSFAHTYTQAYTDRSHVTNKRLANTLRHYHRQRFTPYFIRILILSLNNYLGRLSRYTRGETRR